MEILASQMLKQWYVITIANIFSFILNIPNLSLPLSYIRSSFAAFLNILGSGS